MALKASSAEKTITGLSVAGEPKVQEREALFVEIQLKCTAPGAAAERPPVKKSQQSKDKPVFFIPV
jgi:hypothetical protein